jgi:hypothetical protein
MPSLPPHFRDIAGALEPGGRLVFACWAPRAENRHWLISYCIALRHLGQPTTSTDHTPGPLAFADPEYIRWLLAAVGFAEIMVERTHPTIIGGSPEEEAGEALMMGPTVRRIEAKQPPGGNPPGVAEEIAAAFAAEATSGSIRLPATIFLVTAAAALLRLRRGVEPSRPRDDGNCRKFAYVSAIGVFSSLLHDRG